MAKFYSGIVTDATKELRLDFVMSEERAQDIFAYLLGTAAPVTEDGVERPRKLGECLRDEIRRTILAIEASAILYKRGLMVEEARKKAAEMTIESEVTEEKA